MPASTHSFIDNQDTGSPMSASSQETHMHARRWQQTSPEPIAIVGMACRLPGNISTPSALWELLAEKRTGYKDFDRSRFNIDGYYHPNPLRPGSIHTQGGQLLDCDPELFDHGFFSMPPGEVLTLDPMQRKMVEVSYEAMESAGEPWDRFWGSRTGVFMGNFNTDFYVRQSYDMDFALPYMPTGGSTSILSNRINHLLNLKGPSMTIDTACASSMYALHVAVNALRAGDCDAAIVGGTNILQSPEMQRLVVNLGAASGTSTCHTFDAAADGYCRAEGFCALYLRRYTDALDGEYPIRALIRGTAVNSNGKTAGISHPSPEGQEALIRQAYRNAGLPTHLTGYFECHGTGTPVGDPIEVSAIGKVFAAERAEAPLLIGSVKTNLGHSEAASGVTGVMKSVLALEKGMIPATVGIQQFNPNIDFETARVKVVTEMTPWPKGVLRRVSVNSMGYGGANGHCILDHPETVAMEMAQQSKFDCLITGTPDKNNKADLSNGFPTTLLQINDLHSEATSRTRRMVLLPFSAHDREALSSNIAALRKVISSLPLADVAYTLAKRRSKFLHKTFSIVDVGAPEKGLSVTQTLSARSTQAARLGFVFTGQGAQWQDMGQTLLEYEVFKASIQAQDKALATLSLAPQWTLETIFSGACQRSIQEAEISQTVCTALQVAIVDLLRSWNVSPHATVGHSSGEMAAAYAAGCISRAEAIVTAYCRGRSIAANTQKGIMLAVGIGVDDATKLLEGREARIKIAAINSPRSVTLSGDIEAVEDLHKKMQDEGMFVRILQTSGNAYHSHQMKAIGARYERMLEQCLTEICKEGDDLHPCHWVSSVTPYKTAKPTPAYWRQNLESTVCFSSAVNRLVTSHETRVDALIEIGPHSALQSPLKQILAKTEAEYQTKAPVYLTALRRFEDGMYNLLGLCGSLFQLNYDVDIAAVNSVDQTGFQGITYVHGKVCTEMPTYQYSYGPSIYYESRIAREIRQRSSLHHDLLGILRPGGAKDQPVWRNVLRVKDVPWLNHHQLIPNAVLPGAAYVCLAIEAASQFMRSHNSLPNPHMFKLRKVSIKNAMRIPDNEFGVELLTTINVSSLSPNWLEFKITSIDNNNEGTWSDNASGLISIAKSPERKMIPIKRLEVSMDPRYIDVRKWYEKFNEIGLGYGKAFQGLSNLLTDPYKNIATADLNMNTTAGMFIGPESNYAIHPASLDICFQLALIAVHGGQTGQVRHGFIPISIDEITVWPPQAEESYTQAIAHGRTNGLRNAAAQIQIFDHLGLPRVDITNLKCVSYYGGKGHNNLPRPNEYVRLVWKPDISTMSNEQAHILIPSKFTDSYYAQLETQIDLMSHRDPKMNILQIGAGSGDVPRVVLNTLGGHTDTIRYSKYTLADRSDEALCLVENALSTFKGVSTARFDLEEAPSTQGFEGTYDLVIVTGGLIGVKNTFSALQNLHGLIKPGGKLVLLTSAASDKDWQPLLEDAGYSGADMILQSDGKTASTLISTALSVAIPTSPSSNVVDFVYIIYQHTITPFHEVLAEELRKRCVIPVIAALGSASCVPTGARVIMTMDLEAEGLAGVSENDFGKVKTLAQSVSCLLWLTNGGVLSANDSNAAISTGLMRMLTTEKQESQFGVFHLEEGFQTTMRRAARLVIDHETRLREGDVELEVAMLNGVIYIPRLVYDEGLNSRFQTINTHSVSTVEMPLRHQGPMAVDFAVPGLLNSVYFKADRTLEDTLPKNWIEIKAAAISINRKDIAVATGRSEMNECISECAGTVVACGPNVTEFQPGDRVYALARCRPGTHIRTPESLAQVMSPYDTFEKMSTVPLAFCSATYGLRHLAQLRRGERVLIESATSSTGLAALQVAQLCDAEIFASVGTAEQAAYLTRHSAVPEDHIFWSHDIEADRAAMMEATGGKGFNVVLSIPVGDMMSTSLKCIASRGRFIDVGGFDGQKHSILATEVFECNATFSSFDFGVTVKQEPDFCSELMKEVGSMLRAGNVRPIDEIRTYDVSNLDTAMLTYAKGGHVGKFVVSYENPDATVKMVPPVSRARFDPTAEYVLVGGLGGLGRAVLHWMTVRGARRLTIFSRSGSHCGEAQTMIEDFEARGIRVRVMKVDVTSKVQVDSAIAEASSQHPIKGILHAAVSFADQAFDNVSFADWKLGLSAKVEGSVNLHEASIAHQLPLDFFIMTSSIEAVLALPTQAAYCAANAFQDAFARWRRSLGLPACAIGFGLITEITQVGRRDATVALMRRHQMYETGELEILQLLEAAFLDSPTVDGGNNSWSRFDTLAAAQMTACLDPFKLAKLYKNGQEPRWNSDKKFSHIVAAMMHHLSDADQPVQSKAGRPAIAASLDVAIKANNRQEAISIVAKAVIERTAELLVIDSEGIQESKSVAEYGVDSLIAVELRSWIVGVFDNTLPLLKLLDERVSILNLAEGVVEERIHKR